MTEARVTLAGGLVIFARDAAALLAACPELADTAVGDSLRTTSRAAEPVVFEMHVPQGFSLQWRDPPVHVAAPAWWLARLAEATAEG